MLRQSTKVSLRASPFPANNDVENLNYALNKAVLDDVLRGLDPSQDCLSFSPDWKTWRIFIKN